MKKHVLLTAVLAMCLSLSTVFVSVAGQWQQDSTGWWYTFDDGSFPRNVWLELNKEYYYFDEMGYMLENSITPEGYMVDEEGKLIDDISITTNCVFDNGKTGPYYVKNEWYYFYGDLVPDADRFDVICSADSYYHSGSTTYTFCSDGTYKKAMNEHSGKITLKGKYTRCKNSMELVCEEKYYYEYDKTEVYDENKEGDPENISESDNDKFIIEYGRMWPASLYE